MAVRYECQSSGRGTRTGTGGCDWGLEINPVKTKTPNPKPQTSWRTLSTPSRPMPLVPLRLCLCPLLLPRATHTHQKKKKTRIPTKKAVGTKAAAPRKTAKGFWSQEEAIASRAYRRPCLLSHSVLRPIASSIWCVMSNPFKARALVEQEPIHSYRSYRCWNDDASSSYYYYHHDSGLSSTAITAMSP